MSRFGKRSQYRRSMLWICFALSVWILSGCNVTPETTGVVVSDGITDNDLYSGHEEILPNVTVYNMIPSGSTSFARYLLADNIEGLGVVFYVKRYEDKEWTRLGDDVRYTDEKGRATLPEIRGRLPRSILDEAPVDIMLQARVYFDDTTYVSDDAGMIRVLSTIKTDNPRVVITDHDNTIHATGGSNSLQDWIDFLNWAKNDWPCVDGTVTGAFAELHNEHRDMVIVSGMPGDIRFKCREQINRHFEGSGDRFIPIIVKDDMAFEKTNEFKEAAISILKAFYGDDNILAMVGDTVRQDGYGAAANSIPYIPFQIHYELAPDLLNTKGFGSIDPTTIAGSWQGVLDAIDNGPVIENNFFLKRFRPTLNIAHRGGGDLLPENTIEAYRNAFDAGADAIEGDVHMTADGVVVVSHDATVDRCTDGTGYIMDMTLADIKSLDAGYGYTTDEGETFPFRGMGYAIPTLEEVFSDPVLAGRPMVLEIKQEGREIVEKVLDLIGTYDMENNLIVGAFDQDTVDLIGELSDLRGMSIVKIYATRGVIEFITTPQYILANPEYEKPGDILCLPRELMTPLIMNRARYIGQKVLVWTVNDEADIRYQLDTIDPEGIMTDNPAFLDSLLEF